MGAQICTLHDISANSAFASAHSLMALKTLVSKTTALSVASYFFDDAGVSREVHAPFCERLEVKFLQPIRPRCASCRARATLSR